MSDRVSGCILTRSTGVCRSFHVIANALGRPLTGLCRTTWTAKHVEHGTQDHSEVTNATTWARCFRFSAFLNNSGHPLGEGNSFASLRSVDIGRRKNCVTLSSKFQNCYCRIFAKIASAQGYHCICIAVGFLPRGDQLTTGTLTRSSGTKSSSL